jgi:hypothetical protein
MWDILYMYWYHRQKAERHAICPFKFPINVNWSGVDNAFLFFPIHTDHGSPHLISRTGYFCSLGFKDSSHYRPAPSQHLTLTPNRIIARISKVEATRSGYPMKSHVSQEYGIPSQTSNWYTSKHRVSKAARIIFVM